MDKIRLMARQGGHVKTYSGVGSLPVKFVGDRRFSRRNRAYLAMKAARELVADHDYAVFGEDWRWFHASTPQKMLWRRFEEVAKVIMQQ